MLLSSEILSGVTDDRVLLRWAVLRALRMVAACTNFDTNRGPSRSVKKKNEKVFKTKPTDLFITYDIRSILDRLSSRRFVCSSGGLTDAYSGASAISGSGAFSKKYSYYKNM